MNKKLERILDRIVGVSLAGLTAGFLFYVGHSAVQDINERNQFGKEIKNAPTAEYVVQEGEDYWSLGEVRKKYFPLGIEKLKYTHYADDVATNMWMNRVVNENKIPLSILGALKGNPYILAKGDTLKIPVRN